jgi:AmmeMemoRadiSam system protein A
MAIHPRVKRTEEAKMQQFPAPTDFPPEYSYEERRWLLRLAHWSIRAAVRAQPLSMPDALPGGSAREHLRQPRGAFTTLHQEGQLRGCIGMIMAVRPLDETVCQTARDAALEDPRFEPVREEELERLQIEISVLSPMFEIAPEQVVVGRHGLMISFQGRRGLLLPQVPLEWGWEREVFLAQTCRKAGLPMEAWRHGAKIEAFTAEVFGEREPGESLRE